MGPQTKEKQTDQEEECRSIISQAHLPSIPITCIYKQVYTHTHIELHFVFNEFLHPKWNPLHSKKNGFCINIFIGIWSMSFYLNYVAFVLYYKGKLRVDDKTRAELSESLLLIWSLKCVSSLDKNQGKSVWVVYFNLSFHFPIASELQIIWKLECLYSYILFFVSYLSALLSKFYKSHFPLNLFEQILLCPMEG